MPGDEEKLKDVNGHLPFDVNETMLHAAGIKYFDVTQNRGEVLFVPSGWHHQVHNLVSQKNKLFLFHAGSTYVACVSP